MTKNIPVLFQEKADCCGCGACAAVCSRGVIALKPDVEGFLYPRIEKNRCVGCGRCANVCPMKAPHDASVPERCYAAKMEPFREKSSSGGLFPALARYVLDQGGVVFGAGWTRTMNVEHQGIESMAELGNLQGSKYVQSKSSGAYRAALDALKQGRRVLFTGTPCQTEAMRRAAGGHPKLLTASLVCHGAPSPGLWVKHVQYLEKKHGGTLQSFAFRDKRNRDSGHTTSYRVGAQDFVMPLSSEPYCAMYFSRRIMRPCCHSCPFATPARQTDITIGDAWGIEKLCPEFDDGMGVSLVIPHTDLGRNVWKEICGETQHLEFPMDALLQPQLREPVIADKRRWLALRAWRVLPLKRYYSLINLRKGDLRRRVRGKLKRMLRIRW